MKSLKTKVSDLWDEEKRGKLAELISSLNMDIYVPPCVISMCERMRVFLSSIVIASLYPSFISRYSFYFLLCHAHDWYFPFFFKKNSGLVATNCIPFAVQIEGHDATCVKEIASFRSSNTGQKLHTISVPRTSVLIDYRNEVNITRLLFLSRCHIAEVFTHFTCHISDFIAIWLEKRNVLFTVSRYLYFD